MFFPPSSDRRVRGAARKLEEADEELYESLLAAKLAVVSGFLPKSGGLDDQDPHLSKTIEWLNRAGVLEWLGRPPMM